MRSRDREDRPDDRGDQDQKGRKAAQRDLGVGAGDRVGDQQGRAVDRTGDRAAPMASRSSDARSRRAGHRSRRRRPPPSTRQPRRRATLPRARRSRPAGSPRGAPSPRASDLGRAPVRAGSSPDTSRRRAVFREAPGRSVGRLAVDPRRTLVPGPGEVWETFQSEGTRTPKNPPPSSLNAGRAVEALLRHVQGLTRREGTSIPVGAAVLPLSRELRDRDRRCRPRAAMTSTIASAQSHLPALPACGQRVGRGQGRVSREADGLGQRRRLAGADHVLGLMTASPRVAATAAAR